MVVLYPILVAISLAITLVAVVLSPFLALCADDAGNLPRALRWFQTFDNTLDAGEPVALFGRSWRYLSRVRWLIRNPAYGFDYYLLGVPWCPCKWRVLRYRRDGENLFFFAVGPLLTFDFYYAGRITVKLGWKAWNHFDGTGFSVPWGDGSRLPICFTVKR